MSYQERIEIRPSDQFQKWLYLMEESTDQTGKFDVLRQLMYINQVTLAICGYFLRPDSRLFSRSLYSLLAYFDQEENDEDLKNCHDDPEVTRGCAYTAERWLKDHPDSTDAQAILASGLETPLTLHVNLVSGLYKEYEISERLTHEPILAFIKVNPEPTSPSLN